MTVSPSPQRAGVPTGAGRGSTADTGAMLGRLASLALAGSLPTGGPPVLHAPPPRVPELANRAPFRAAPLLVSGTDAYRRGEYLYQDYLLDDRGADTRPVGNAAQP